MSLYDLIYSQQSETHQEELPAPSNAKRRKLNDKNDAAALDSFYGIQPRPPTPISNDFSKNHKTPDVIISNGIERRRKKKRGRNNKRGALMHGDDDEDELWETLSEAKARIERATRKRNYKYIKNRWKAKEFSLENEEDYGNSVLHMARKVMKRRQKPTDDDEDDRKPAALPNVQQEQKDDDLEMNSSDEEQQEALGSLWASLTPHEQDSDAASGDDNDDEEQENQKADDYSSWDFRQLGYDTPRKVDLQDFNYNKHGSKNHFQVNLAARKRRIEEMEAVSFTPKPPKLLSRRFDNEQYYLDTDFPTTRYAHIGFHHATSLRAMAGRFLLGSAGKNVDLENRLLRDLFSMQSQTVGREYHVLCQAMEHGCDFVLFQGKRWKQRDVAARVLGMTPAFHHSGPRNRIGYTLERNAINKQSVQFRNRVLRLLSDGQDIPYQPEEESSTDTVELMDQASQADGSPDKILNDVNAKQHDEMEELDESPLKKRARIDTVDAPDVVKSVGEQTLEDPDASYFRTFMGSQVDYIHRPGSCPPVPCLPLDETGVVLGGEDRYSRVYYNAKIDEATYNATMSVLLARLGRARLEKDSNTIEQVTQQITTYVEESVQENVTQLEHVSFMRRKRTELPSPLHYRAIMGLCSFIANGGSWNTSTNAPGSTKNAALDGENGTHSKNEAGASDSLTLASNAKTVAQEMHSRCAESPTSTSLTIFPRIHVVTALALIAKNLPPSAAEILSRPFDDLSHRTPFDIMRKTLEHLEENRLLVESGPTTLTGETVSVGYLEHVVREATSIFRRALEIDPTDMVNHAWYVSSLSASLLLCSGNAIGGTASIFPSSKQGDDYDSIFSSRDKSTNRRNGVRQKMAKFTDTRVEVATAVKKMIQQTFQESSSIGNLMGSAVLEWKQMMAFLVGPTALIDEPSPWLEIRRLHSRYVVQWAITEKSRTALDVVEDIVRNQHASRENLLELLASAVENDPSDVFAWRRLVQVLGPVGTIVPSRQRKECNRSSCADCKRVREGLNENHAVLAERMGGRNWWGKDRSLWWDKHVIALESDSNKEANAKEIFRVKECIEQQLSREKIPAAPDGIQEKQRIEAFGSGDEREDLSWLNGAMVSSGDGDDNAELSDSVDDLLPTPFEETTRRRERSTELPSSPVFGLNNGEARLEMLCFKIIVLCHLYGMSHELITEGVWSIAQACVNEGIRADGREWKCLSYLSRMGMNIPQILHDLYSQATTKVRNVSAYPPEEKEAIRVGLEIFGKEWIKIRDFFHVFKDSTRKHVEFVYLSMKSHGEL